MKDFDLIHDPLQGNNLIEAGAGTGKTYTIAGLFVRLMVEQDLFIDQILVVTYTVAATEELKDRIRRKLREALHVFSTGQAEDSFLQGLLQKYPDGSKRTIVCDRLAMAIRNFDEAAIYTIHGFCQRILRECAFESRFLFDTELVTNQQKLKEEVIQDFWRRHFYEGIPDFIGYALKRGYSPASFLKLFGREISNPDINVLPEDTPPTLASIEILVDAFHGEFAKLKMAWAGVKEEVRKCLKDPGLKANIYGVRVDSLIDCMDRFVTSRHPFLALSDDFEKFTASKIAASTKKGRTPPEHPVFQICESLKNGEEKAIKQMDRHLLFLKAKLIGVINVELPAVKQKKNIMFYDDLLIKLRTALEGEGGASLAEVVRGKYRAALIDEFQDTDPIQYAIFHTIFGKDKERILFLIGDPKQAIYSFRGADLFAYIRAAADVDNKYTLRHNWRSVPDLVGAINTLFSASLRPFVQKEILFYPTHAAMEHAKLPGLTIEGKVEAPFQWWFVPAGSYSSQEKPLAKDPAKQVIARAVAGEIARLVSLGKDKRALIDGEPLAERDIAVLVRTNLEARQMKKALVERKIPCVLYSTENVFDSGEAAEMERLLMGIAYLADERRFKAALVTSLIGVSGNDIDLLKDDENQWALWLQRFKIYHDLWSTRGFIVMFRILMDSEKVRSRLLAFSDGERRLTNVLHLSEILHQETLEQNLGMSDLLKWLGELRNPETPREKEEHQLRLESDENAVRIATIHKSKGLEYPIVFCPFSWEGAKVGKDSPFTFHDPQNDYRFTYELGSADWQAHKKWAEEELLAENMRLLYVALTRAKYCCYFVWGRFNGSETSAAAYLFHGDGRIEHGLDEMAGRVKNLSDEAMFNELTTVACEGKGNINLCEIPASMESIPILRQAPGNVLHCRDFQGIIDRSWRVTSFSSFVSKRPQKVDFPDWDATEDGENILYQRSSERWSSDLKPSIFNLPGGVHTGSLLHDILQHFDFIQKDQSIAEALVAEKLEEYGFDSKWAEIIVEMLGNVIRTPIEPRDNTLTLSAISTQDRINELEFYFPLEGLSWDLLWRLLDARGIDRLSKTTPDIAHGLSFDPVRGFMKGFIDMVFHYKGRYFLVDWKSNDLGDQKDNYSQEALLSTMKDSFYLLQSFLYTVALHRYLSYRVDGYRYEIHFGGVYYLFLRGINPAWGTDYGIYRDKPQEGVIDAFCRQFIKKYNFPSRPP